LQYRIDLPNKQNDTDKGKVRAAIRIVSTLLIIYPVSAVSLGSSLEWRYVR